MQERGARVLDKVLGGTATDLGGAVLDVMQGEQQATGTVFGAAVDPFATIVDENGLDGHTQPRRRAGRGGLA